jgi:hypothetical protein
VNGTGACTLRCFVFAKLTAGALRPFSKQFSSIMEKLELVLTMRKYPESRRLLADYTMLNPHSDPQDFEYAQVLPCCKPDPPFTYDQISRDVSEEKFNTMEDRFLLASREMLLKANFTPVTREEVPSQSQLKRRCPPACVLADRCKS